MGSVWARQTPLGSVWRPHTQLLRSPAIPNPGNCLSSSRGVRSLLSVARLGQGLHNIGGLFILLVHICFPVSRTPENDIPIKGTLCFSNPIEVTLISCPSVYMNDRAGNLQMSVCVGGVGGWVYVWVCVCACVCMCAMFIPVAGVRARGGLRRA